MSNKLASGGAIDPERFAVMGERDEPEIIKFGSAGRVITKGGKTENHYTFNFCSSAGVRRIKVDKQKQRIRFENETEGEVTIVIEPKEK